jgi:hypothetical protein
MHHIGAAMRTRDNAYQAFRGRLLDLLDELGLGKLAWQGRNNVNVIGNTADMHESAPTSRQIVAR